jgi:hypothetical protein
MRFNPVSLWCLGCLALVQISQGEESVNVEWKPVSFGMGIEFGQVLNGTYYENNQMIDRIVIPRTGVGLTHTAVIEKNLEVKIGVGGLFWYGFPEAVGEWWTQGTKFGPGISVATGTYTFGNPVSSHNYLQVGYFPMKYNPMAVNLGEYLFRSGTYPGYLLTGDWQIVNSASYNAQGARLHFENLDGALTHDFTLFMERDFAPFFDFTPTYLVSYRKGIFQVGGGASFNHYLAIRPSQLTPKSPLSNYVTFANLPATVGSRSNLTGDTVFAAPAGPRSGLEAQLNQLIDSAGGNPAEEKMYTDKFTKKLSVTKDDAAYTANPGDFIETTQFRYARTNQYLTFKGIKLMANLSLDFKEITGLDFRLFAELAMLGVENQPYYFEDPLERIPIMAGLDVPTGGLLDRLCIQGEYYNSKYINSLENFQKNIIPVWFEDPTYGDLANRDDLRWSVYAKRSLVASDHLRLQDWRGKLSQVSVVSVPKEWYYFIRLEFGI